MSEQFAGAKWWKFDFHTHTPASHDFLKGVPEEVRAKFTPEDWLKRFMEKEIDCVAITDHNSGEWIDKLKEAYRKLEEGRSETPWFRPLYLFPGVEITVHGGVHILAILDPGKSTGDIDHILGAVEYQGSRGESDDVTTKSFTEVADAIAKSGGIVIPAHVDRPKGLFGEQDIQTLNQALNNQNVCAMELLDEGYALPNVYLERGLQWVKVRGSDTHNFWAESFGHFTWVKMDEPPSIGGLKLALIDGTASVSRDMCANPNRHAELFIEELEVEKARFLGRSKPLRCRFSPFLNTIIGGRGSGKSTLLEFMRLALRREEDIPKSLKEESKRYFEVGEDNLLLGESHVAMIYRKGDVRYRLNWSNGGKRPSIEKKADGKWGAEPGEIMSLFPAYIYSQKEVFELAKKPSALFDIIDKAAEVAFASFDEQRKELVNRYKQIEHKIRELDGKIEQEDKLRGETNDLDRQIDQIEQSGHSLALQNFRKRRQQQSKIASIEDKWQEMVGRIENLRESVAPVQFTSEYFDEDGNGAFRALEEANGKWEAVSTGLRKLTEEAQKILSDWQVEKAKADWMRAIKAEIGQYDRLRSDLSQKGIDPDKYPNLLSRRRTLSGELQNIDAYRSRVQELEEEKQVVLDRILENRKALTKRREDFVTKVLEGNPSVRIEIVPFGQDWEGIEKKVRSILQFHDRFERDFEQLKSVYGSNGEHKFERLKGTIESVRNGEGSNLTGWFSNRLKDLPQESMSDFNLWFPEDGLKITFGDRNQPIEQGSPGQKTAALLAFILSYGEEPLLLDQPEDDLDNELIYSLIVQELRETKSRRQVIVVTHNANIVVNGDAEMVFPLEVAGGETHVSHHASIQDKRIRRKICDILEGGERAFEQRYKRIHLES